MLLKCATGYLSSPILLLSVSICADAQAFGCGCRHPNVIRYRTSFVEPTLHELCIVSDFCSGGDLQHTIKQRKTHFPEEVRSVKPRFKPRHSVVSVRALSNDRRCGRTSCSCVWAWHTSTSAKYCTGACVVSQSTVTVASLPVCV